jgi:transcriptional regulator with XRE-family HTH domain
LEKLISERRDRAGLTLDALAASAGVAESAVIRMTRRDRTSSRPPEPATLDKLARVLGGDRENFHLAAVLDAGYAMPASVVTASDEWVLAGKRLDPRQRSALVAMVEQLTAAPSGRRARA